VLGKKSWGLARDEDEEDGGQGNARHERRKAGIVGFETRRWWDEALEQGFGKESRMICEKSASKTTA